MLPALLLSGAVLLGVEGSTGYGEDSPGYVAEAVSWGDRHEIALRASALDKVGGGGWYLKGWADACRGHACLGLGATHRDGGGVCANKDVLWLRGGARVGSWRATLAYAHKPDQVLQLWISGLDVVSLDPLAGGFALRLEAGPSWYRQPGQDWRTGWHARLLVGLGRGK